MKAWVECLLFGESFEMSKSETPYRAAVLRILRSHRHELATKYGVTRLGIFGSVARDCATERSDVDVVVDMPPDLFMMVHMKEDLEEMLGADVDLVRLHHDLSAYLKERIDAEAIYV
jgi:uncharacterized protein